MNDSAASLGLVSFLFGVFCAYWAQTSERSAWLWFFFGLVFSPIAGVVLLWKNHMDRVVSRARAGRGVQGTVEQTKDAV